MKWNFLALLVVLISSCRTADVVTWNADEILDTIGPSAYYSSFSTSIDGHAPIPLDEPIAGTSSDAHILLANDVWSDTDGNSRMEVTVWNSNEPGLGWNFENKHSGTLQLEDAPGFEEGCFPLSVDVAIGNEGKTAMVVFQAVGRVYYSVYQWDGTKFFLSKKATQLGDLKLTGYGVPRIDCDPNRDDDRVIITWASYKGPKTSIEYEEIWAVAGYINGSLIHPNTPYPVSRMGGVSTESECFRPDVSYRNNKGYFSYSYKNKEGKNVLVEQEVQWDRIADGALPLAPARLLQTSDKLFVFARIAANKAKANTVEWQVVSSTTQDSIRRIIGYNKIHQQKGVNHIEISNDGLIECRNTHPAVAIVDDYVFVAWIHESNGCLPDLIDKELLQQRIDIRTGKLIDKDDYAVINSEQMGDQRAIAISGYFGNGNAFYSFHDSYRNQIVTKSSHNTDQALNPVATIDNMDITGTTTGSQELDPGANDVATALNLFPNPAHEDLQIDFQGNWASEATVAIYNNQGTMVKNLQVVTETTAIDVSDLEPGPFYVMVSDATRQVKQSFMVQ